MTTTCSCCSCGYRRVYFFLLYANIDNENFYECFSTHLLKQHGLPVACTPHLGSQFHRSTLSPGLRVPVLSPVPSYPLSPVSASLLFKSGEFLSIQSYSNVISSVRPPSALASSWPLHLLLPWYCLHSRLGQTICIWTSPWTVSSSETREYVFLTFAYSL